jgi:RNA polymerase sigma factor (sigma-70 family)
MIKNRILTDNELRILFEIYEKNDNKEYMEDIIFTYTYGFVIHYARKFYYNKYMEIDDVIQEGSIGLLKAIRTYKHDSISMFSTYAYPCIRNQIMTALPKYMPISITYNVFHIMTKVAKFKSDFLKENGVLPSIKQIERSFSSISTTTLKSILSASKKISSIQSLDEKFKEDDNDEYNLYNTIIDSANNPEVELEIKERDMFIIRLLKTIKEKDRILIAKRFGILKEEEMTYENLSKLYNVSRQCLQQKVTNLLKKLRKNYFKILLDK